MKASPLVRIRDLFTNDTEVKWSGELVSEALIDDGDILIGMDGDFNVTMWDQGPALLNQRLCCVRALNGSMNQKVDLLLPAPATSTSERCDLRYYSQTSVLVRRA